jgi:protocatechuate 3,4-dioxygenase beta subunit
MNQHDHHDLEEHDRGLHHDLQMLGSMPPRVSRRNALKLFGGASVLALAACGSKSTTSASSSTTTAAAATTGTTATTVAAGAGAGPDGAPPGGAPPGGGTGGGGAGSQPADGTIPIETAGPYPGDGSNGPNVLTQSGIVRSDITTSIGSSTKTPGVPLTVKLKITNGANGPIMPGAAVYLWHCDRAGGYSMYSQGITNETYLRGVQATDANGEVTFTTIYPAAYSGRWPHIHFEVYSSLAAALAGTPKLATSQLAMTAETAKQVFAVKGYEASIANLASSSLATDNVFSDGADKETPTFTGDIIKGFVATLTCPIAG